MPVEPGEPEGPGAGSRSNGPEGTGTGGAGAAGSGTEGAGSDGTGTGGTGTDGGATLGTGSGGTGSWARAGAAMTIASTATMPSLSARKILLHGGYH